MLQNLGCVSRIAAFTIAVLSLTVCSCRSQSNAPKAGARSYAELHSTDADVACVGDASASDPIPFAPVDLGRVQREAAQQERILTGPRTRKVILDSLAWPSAWRVAVDTVPVPSLTFGDDALVLVGTQTYTVGPFNLDVVAIRRCRATGVIVVAVEETGVHGGVEDHGSRGLSVVRVHRAALAGKQVKFVDLPERLLP
jgi:hypothetical protein